MGNAASITQEAVQRAYGARVAEYAAVLGNVEGLAMEDVALVRSWAQGISGEVLDVGCGPGHWTDWLRTLGTDITGIDPTPEFVVRAAETFPGTRFRLGSAESTGAKEGEIGGVLAWYSLIHLEPGTMRAALDEFHRILEPGGGFALGFFEGPRLEPFAHAITTAYYWPMDLLKRRIEAAGFTVLHSETRTDTGARKHGAITAVRNSDNRPEGAPRPTL